MMSATTSATTGRRYGLERVCRTWERSRSALYARRARAQCRKRGAGPARRGPTPALSDAQLLAAIRSDLTRSPFQGEGHRKVHARLRILDGIRVSRTRVLRVMRAQGLLSPHDGAGCAHGFPLRLSPPQGRSQTPLQPVRTTALRHSAQRPGGLVFLRHRGLILLRP